MGQRERELGFSLSQDFDTNEPDKTPGVKQFTECKCEKPIVKPISYVLPDHRFISLLLCKACNGLERYSITELPNGEDTDDEELNTIDSLMEDIDALEQENERLEQKLRRQSRRIRISQNPQFSDGEQAVTPPEGIIEEGTGTGEKQKQEQEREHQSTPPQFNTSRISKTGKKILVASLILGVGVIGTTILRTTPLSSLAIILGILLIVLPVFFLTNGEIPQNHKEA
jgi:hypothetical protein